METGLTSVVPPCQLDSVHEENLLLTIDNCIQAQTAEAAELGVEKDFVGLTVAKPWAGWLREMLSCKDRL